MKIKLLFLLFLTGSVCAQSADDGGFTIVEEVPEFPGGDAALYRFLFTNLKYPKDAVELKKEGKVIVSFVILEDGKVDTASVSILKGFFCKQGDRESHSEHFRGSFLRIA